MQGLLAIGGVRVKIEMNGWYLCAAALLGSVGQCIKANLYRRRMGTTLGMARLDEDVRILLLSV